MNMVGQIQQEIPESTDGNVVDNLAAADAVVPLSLFTDALLCNRFDGKNKNLSVAEVETVSEGKSKTRNILRPRTSTFLATMNQCFDDLTGD